MSRNHEIYEISDFIAKKDVYFKTQTYESCSIVRGIEIYEKFISQYYQLVKCKWLDTEGEVTQL